MPISAISDASRSSTAWFCFVLPALLINYFGQGALVLSNPAAIESSFYRMAPDMLLLPLVVLATAATVIASQAVITGAFSLVRQAVQLGLLPRFEVRYTSETHAGQIYLPRVNRLLLIGVLLLVLLFRTSSGLASAYGIAVSTTMVVDGIMGFVVIWKLWNWRAATAAAVIVPFVVVDMTFFAANLLKLLEGAWVPLLFGVRDGDDDLDLAARGGDPGGEDPPDRGAACRPDQEPGKASAAHRQGHRGFPDQRPQLRADGAAAQSQAQQGAARAERDPHHRDRRDAARGSGRTGAGWKRISDKFSTVRLRFGFMESPNVPKALVIARKLGWQFDIMATSFFVSRRSLKPSAQSGMPQWQDHLFIAMSRSANDATDYFQIPTGRVVEVGTQVTI